jgi:hypothetical protein
MPQFPKRFDYLVSDVPRKRGPGVVRETKARIALNVALSKKQDLVRKAFSPLRPHAEPNLKEAVPDRPALRLRRVLLKPSDFRRKVAVANVLISALAPASERLGSWVIKDIITYSTLSL